MEKPVYNPTVRLSRADGCRHVAIGKGKRSGMSFVYRQGHTNGIYRSARWIGIGTELNNQAVRHAYSGMFLVRHPISACFDELGVCFHPIGVERRIGVEISHDHTVVQLIVLYVFCQHLRFFQSELPVVRAEMGDDDIQSIRFTCSMPCQKSSTCFFTTVIGSLEVMPTGYPSSFTMA